MKTNFAIRMFCLIGVLLLLSSFFVQESYATSAATGVVEIRQPNGSRFKAVQKGDEWLNWVEIEQGYTIAQQADGYWYYVERYDGKTPIITSTYAHEAPPTGAPQHIRPDPSLYKSGRLAEAPEAALAQAPFGPFNGKILYILTSFSDRAGTTTEASWATFINSNINDFFNKASYGKVTLSAATESFGAANNGVVGWVNVGYAHPNTSGNTGTANQQLAKDAILAANTYVNFAVYDLNGDTFVDADELAVVVIAAGYEAALTGHPSPSLWGHKWSIGSVTPPIVDGVTVGAFHNGAGGYAQFGELHQFSTPPAWQATMGIQVHELGHLIFALPDLYDTDNSSSGLGVWCVMSGGSWGASSSDANIGQTPVLPSAWVKYNRGWVNGSEGNGTESLTGAGENSATSSNTVYKASTCNTPNEYFLVENRRPVGYDRGLERSLGTNFGGLAIFHVDDAQTSNANDSHRWVDVEEADGETDNPGQTTDLWRVGNAVTFNNASTPNSNQYNGSPSNVAITSVSAAATVMTANFASCAAPVDDITVTSPNGGENWQVGTTQTITWTSTGTSGIVDIDLSTNGGTSYTPIFANTNDDGSQSWTIPNSPSTNCLIRITDNDGNPSDVSNAPFTISTTGGVPNDNCATATVVTSLPFTDMQDTRLATDDPTDPVLSCADGGGGKTVWYSFTPASNVFVSVNTIGSSPNDYDTALGIFTGSCGSLVEILCNDDVESGTIRQSEIVFEAQAGITYIIHVAEWNGGGPSGGVPTGGDLVFNIEATTTGSITVTSPNGGESWQVGTTQTITWTSTGTSGLVDIGLSTNGGTSYTPIFSDITDDGSQSWTIPNSPSTNCLIRITDNDGSPSDVSNAPFSITTPENITVTAPNGGENWQVGTTQTITWTSSGTSGLVDIDLSTNGGTSYSPIFANTTDDGSQSWVIPNSPSANCLIRITDNDGSPADVSNAAFGIVTAACPAWLVPITVTGGSVTLNLEFGGDPNATNGFDSGCDLTAAPPGFNYYAYFSIAPPVSFLSRDIRGWISPFNTDINWTLRVLNADGITSQMSWNTNALPAEGSFRLKEPNLGIDVDIRQQSSVQFSGNASLIIEYRLQACVTFDFPVATGAWYLISLPVIPNDKSVSTLFPDALAAFGWDYQLQSYVPATQLEPAKAYWLLMLQAKTVEICGLPLNSYTHNYTTPGWDLTGSVMQSRPLVDNPAGSVLAMFGWDPLTQNYVTVNPYQVEPKQGYWILVFNAPSTVSVGSGSSSVAKLGASADLTAFYEKYGTLPPPPPYGLAGGKFSPVPTDYGLSQNYPNPFNPETVIEYQLPQAGRVSLKIYSILGQEVRTLVEGERPAGHHWVKWDGKDESGQKVESGVYLYRLQADNFMQTKKFVLMK